MTIHREWLDWTGPALPAAAAWLIDRALEDDPSAARGSAWCDLQSAVCVLPGRRAGRILLAQLLEQCRSRGLEIVPPTVLTPGALIDFVLSPAGAIANSVEVE